jgi:outer membrane protein, heavy metal efflux system
MGPSGNKVGFSHSERLGSGHEASHRDSLHCARWSSGRRILAIALANVSLIGCATRKYQSVPIAPSKTANLIQGRSLTDPDLGQFVQSRLRRSQQEWPPQSWTPAELMLAALYFSHDLDIARTEVQAARAGVISAGARPNPTLDIAPGYSTFPEPWLFDAVFGLPIETAGKRGRRIETAQRQADVARWQLGEAGWQVRARVRSALVDFFLTEQRLSLLRNEEQLRAENARLIERRVQVGELPSPELDSARIELANNRVAIGTAQSQVTQARAETAASLGVPLSALDGIQFEWSTLNQPPPLKAVDLAEVERTAVLNRLDLRRSLAEYAVADSNLRLELARQYPDLQLGPGYSIDEGANKFTLGLSLVLPIFNRNQGPIAEAEARRKQAGERFLALQFQVLSEVEKALAAYRGAMAELQAANTVLEVQRQTEGRAQRSFDLGESDRLALAGMRLQTEVAERARLDAVHKAQAALGALENAAQRPLEPTWDLPGLPGSANPSLDLLKGGRR